MLRIVMVLIVCSSALGAQITSPSILPMNDIGWQLHGAMFYGQRTDILSITRTRNAPAFPLDTLGGEQSRGHTRLGAVLGILGGASIGYLVAVPRVRATERRSDGPFQQIEYVTDPVLGGILGGVLGAVIGGKIR